MKRNSKPKPPRPPGRPPRETLPGLIDIKAAPVTERRAADRDKFDKTQLVEMVAEKTGLTKEQSGEAISTLLEYVISALRRGRSVSLPGLGTLNVRRTAARTVVLPDTGKKIQIPAGKNITFKADLKLRLALEKGKTTQ